MFIFNHSFEIIVKTNPFISGGLYFCFNTVVSVKSSLLKRLDLENYKTFKILAIKIC